MEWKIQHPHKPKAKWREVNISKEEFTQMVALGDHTCVGPCACTVEIRDVKAPFMSKCPNGWMTKVGAYYWQACNALGVTYVSLQKARDILTRMRTQMSEADKLQDEALEEYKGITSKADRKKARESLAKIKAEITQMRGNHNRAEATYKRLQKKRAIRYQRLADTINILYGVQDPTPKGEEVPDGAPQ